MSVSLLSGPEPSWFKSSYSGGNATECVEVALVQSGVLVRDSKRPEWTHLTISAEAWGYFLAVAHRAAERRPYAPNW